MAKTKIKGIQGVQKKLNEALGMINANTIDGVAAAGQFIKGESQKLTSIAAKDGGTLIRSAFSRQTDQSGLTQEVGYTASYAADAHEFPNKTRWNRPGAENKFLEKAISRNLTEIANLIARFSGKPS